jgi:hypothetical protein
MPPDRDERIRQRAYEIWEREGRPHGRDEEHWRMALDELVEEFSEASVTQAVPAARVTGTAKPGGEAAVEAQPSQPVSGTGNPAQPTSQTDPPGLAPSQGKAAAAPRGPAGRRGGQARKPANGAPPAGSGRPR